MDLPVLITYANRGYAPFAVNLLANLLKKTTKHRLHFYCLDEEIYQILTTQFGQHSRFIFQRTFGADSGVSKEFVSYGSTEYNRLTHTKLYFIRDALNHYSYIHFIDCDVVCLKEPDMAFYALYKDYDIVFQYDCGWKRETGQLDPFNNWVCTGNMTLRKTPGTTYILNKIEEVQMRLNKNDQECLKEYFDSAGIQDIRTEPAAKLFVYPAEIYTNGYLINNDLITTEKTYFFHANHVVGGNDKVKLLKKVGEWYLV